MSVGVPVTKTFKQGFEVHVFIRIEECGAAVTCSFIWSHLVYAIQIVQNFPRSFS